MALDFSPLVTFLRELNGSKPDRNLNLPPGPRKLPMIGNLHQLAASSKLPHQTLSDMAQKHGPVMHLQLGQVNMVVISSPEAAKEVMKTHDATFANRPLFAAAELIGYKGSSMVTAPCSEYRRQLRKICTTELLSTKRIQTFRTLREGEFSSMCKWIASNEGSKIDLTKRIHETTCGVVLQAFLGKNTKELPEYASIAKEMSSILAGFSVVDLYPSIRLLGILSGMRNKAESLHKRSDRIFEDIINDIKIADNKYKRREDLATILLKFNDPGHPRHLTVDNIKAVIQDMLFGGTDTSSVTTDWAMAEMIRHPTVLKKAQDEVRQAFSNKGFVDESDFHELKYLKFVIKETLRLHPAAPLVLPRENSEDCEIYGYQIPAKTKVLVNAWAIGRHSEHWDEAEKFIPERYFDNPVDYKGNDFEYIPFGAGRRICPGMSFGLANVELPLAMLLYHFNWDLPDGIKPENVDMTESFGITVGRKNPLNIIPIVKKPFVGKKI